MFSSRSNWERYVNLSGLGVIDSPLMGILGLYVSDLADLYSSGPASLYGSEGSSQMKKGTTGRRIEVLLGK